MIFLSVLPLRIPAGVGEHPDLETLGKLLTLASDKRSLDIVLEVSEIQTLVHEANNILRPADVISDCAPLVTILLPNAGVAQGQSVGELSKLTNNYCLLCSNLFSLYLQDSRRSRCTCHSRVQRCRTPRRASWR